MARILIDGYNLGLHKGTGVATYARNLSYELKSLGHRVDVLYGNKLGASRDPLLREIAFFDGPPGSPKAIEWLSRARQALRAPLGFRASQVPITGNVITRTFAARMPHYDAIYNASEVFRDAHSAFSLYGRRARVELPEAPDLAHWTYPLPIAVPGRPNIYTLHDLVPLKLPYTTLDNKRRYLKLMNLLAAKADHIVTVSESSRRDLVELLRIPEDRVTNTYQSVQIPARYREKDEAQVAREVEGAAGVEFKKYYLFWGSIEPKKNIGRMIEAYLASKVDAPLVIVGAQAWKADEELRLLNDQNMTFSKAKKGEQGSRRRVIQLSYAPFGLLVSLIRGAKAALFPSLYEGFGLPALEAMLLGTPVITSNTSSLPEVAGEAALLVDPYDPGAISSAIRQLDADADLRAELSRRGLVQAALFSPEAYRQRLQGVYDRFL